jgi:2-iminobutanoate/2-iminopropanoate deaminase
MSNQANKQSMTTFGPYSPVRQSGDTYYISGQIGVDPNTKIASEGAAEQVHQALKNLGEALSSVGLGFNDIVKTTLYLTDMTTFKQVNDIYVGYFEEPRPARTTIGVAELPRVGSNTKLIFEIDAVAARSTS